MSRAVTAHEQRRWDALHEHRGTAAAARALGVTSAAVRAGALAYMAKQGIEGPVPFTIPRKAVRSRDLIDAHAEVERLRARVEELETENEALRLAAHPWVAVHAKLDALLKRPVGVTAVTHRRIADGGIGGKRERKPRPMGLTA